MIQGKLICSLQSHSLSKQRHAGRVFLGGPVARASRGFPSLSPAKEMETLENAIISIQSDVLTLNFFNLELNSDGKNTASHLIMLNQDVGTRNLCSRSVYHTPGMFLD